MATVEMTDVYRSLVGNLKDKLGGTITDANADAIAHAAAQVYRREVEPRLWEDKSAHQLLDSFGVPRSGAFVPYSLTDRLLLLHRNGDEDPYRAQAHELLDELAIPRMDGTGRPLPLRARLTRLLESLEDGSGLAAPTPGPGAMEAPDGADRPPDQAPAGHPGKDKGGDEGEDEDGPGEGQDTSAPEGTPGGPELVDALEAIQRAVGPAGEEEPIVAAPPTPPPPAPPAPPAPDLIGVGSLLGSIQEELVEVRQAVESLRQELGDAVALFQAGGGSSPVPSGPPEVAVPDAGPEIAVPRSGGAPETGLPEAGPPEAGPGSVLSGTGSPDGGRDNAGPVAPLEPTRVLPAVAPVPAEGAAVVEEEPVAEPLVAPRRRSRRFVLLVLLVVLIGVLLAAGITAAVVLGWDQLQSRFIDTIVVPLWDGAEAASW